jgi:rare lipoprotein A
LAEGVGFEPTVELAPTAVFKTAALNHSATLPGVWRKTNTSSEYFPQGRYGRASPRVVDNGRAVPRGGGRRLVGKPYTIAGKRYFPREVSPGFSQTGMSSWYGDAFHGRKTANGEIYDMSAISAAHPTMPLPSYARVTNLKNGHSIIVRVNDRGPYHGGRVIDVSKRVADALDFRRSGTARVKVDYVGPAGVAGSDDRRLMASLTRNGSPAQLDGGAGTFGRTMIAAVTPAAAPQPVAQAPVQAQPAPVAAAPVVATAAPVVAPVAEPGTTVVAMAGNASAPAGRVALATPVPASVEMPAYAPLAAAAPVRSGDDPRRGRSDRQLDPRPGAAPRDVLRAARTAGRCRPAVAKTPAFPTVRGARRDERSVRNIALGGCARVDREARTVHNGARRDMSPNR